MKLIVADIGPAQGLRGEVRVKVRTDSPEQRFAQGKVLYLEPHPKAENTDIPRQVHIARMRTYKHFTYLLFDEITNRTEAENLRGAQLFIDVANEETSEENAWYLHELKGLEVLDLEGYELGRIIGLEHGVAQDIIVVREPGGTIARVPFVHEIVTEVDIDDHCIVVDPPLGLFTESEEEAENED